MKRRGVSKRRPRTLARRRSARERSGDAAGQQDRDVESRCTGVRFSEAGEHLGRVGNAQRWCGEAAQYVKWWRVTRGCRGRRAIAALGVLATGTLSLAFATTQFQDKGLWLVAASITALLYADDTEEPISA